MANYVNLFITLKLLIKSVKPKSKIMGLINIEDDTQNVGLHYTQGKLKIKFKLSHVSYVVHVYLKAYLVYGISKYYLEDFT